MSNTITLNTKAYNWAGFNTQQQSVWKYAGSGIPVDFSYLTNRTVSSTGGKQSTVRWNLSVPHVATEATSCACPGGLLGTDYVRIEVQVRPGSTTSERADLLARIQGLVAHADFASSLNTLSQPTSA